MAENTKTQISGEWNITDCMFLSCHIQVSVLIQSIIWPVWLNDWVFIYELSGCGFKSSCSHLNFSACFDQGVPWHSDNYRVWIHSEKCRWHDKNIPSNALYR